MSEEKLKSYWLSAGSTLYYEKQPSAGFIPRQGLTFISEEVFRAEDVRAYITALQRRVEWTKEAPKVEGWYWWRDKSRGKRDVLKVERNTLGDLSCWELTVKAYDFIDDDNEWSNVPLEPPHEARG